MSYWKKCLSTGDYQFVATGDPAPGDIVVQWWEAELARKDKRIAELETAKDNYKHMVVEQKQRIAELKEQVEFWKEHHKTAHDEWTIEAQNVKDLEQHIAELKAELEAKNKEIMCAMREWYEDGFNRGDCGELIVKHGGEA